MEQRRFGNSGLSVSVLSFGTMTVGGRDRFGKMGSLGVADTSRILDICREAGVTTIDTADIYSFGGAEDILGEALVGRRHEFVAGHQGVQSPRHRPARRRAVAQAPDRGLRGKSAPPAHRLHRPLHLSPAGHVRRGRRNDAGLRRSRVAGQGSLRRLLESRRLAGHEGARGFRAARPDAIHLPAGQLLPHLTRRRARDHPAWPRSVPGTHGVESAPCRAADRQVPARRAARGQPSERARRAGHDRLRTRLPDRRRADATLRRRASVTPAQVALNWVLSKPGVDTVILGARNEEQLRDNLAAATWRLSAEEVARLDEVSALPEPYPMWHQHKFGVERNPPLPAVRA